MRHTGAPDARARLARHLETIELEGAAAAAAAEEQSDAAAYLVYMRATTATGARDSWRTIVGREDWACYICDELISKGEHHDVRTYHLPGEGRITERRCDSCTRHPDWAVTAHERGDRK